MTSRLDVLAGRATGLQINELTFEEKLKHIARCGYRPLGDRPTDYAWALKTFPKEIAAVEEYFASLKTAP